MIGDSGITRIITYINLSYHHHNSDHELDYLLSLYQAVWDRTSYTIDKCEPIA